MAEQAIKLKIAGKSYSFRIQSEKEELYRIAEKEVNNYLSAIKQNNYKGWSDNDYLGMTALKFAIASTDLKHSRELDNGEVEQIAQTTNQIEEYLDKIK